MLNPLSRVYVGRFRPPYFDSSALSVCRPLPLVSSFPLRPGRARYSEQVLCFSRFLRAFRQPPAASQQAAGIVCGFAGLWGRRRCDLRGLCCVVSGRWLWSCSAFVSHRPACCASKPVFSRLRRPAASHPARCNVGGIFPWFCWLLSAPPVLGSCGVASPGRCRSARRHITLRHPHRLMLSR